MCDGGDTVVGTLANVCVVKVGVVVVVEAELADAPDAPDAPDVGEADREDTEQAASPSTASTTATAGNPPRVRSPSRLAVRGSCVPHISSAVPSAP